jgi:hypothetical protein
MNNTRTFLGLSAGIIVAVATIVPASADLVVGTAKSERLHGTIHADTIKGRGGADRVEADGRDTVHAGPGADLIRVAFMRTGTEVSCGKGEDTLVSFSESQFDGTFVSCEHVRHHPAG